jgi:hypothetical protein
MVQPICLSKGPAYHDINLHPNTCYDDLKYIFKYIKCCYKVLYKITCIFRHRIFHIYKMGKNLYFNAQGEKIKFMNVNYDILRVIQIKMFTRLRSRAKGTKSSLQECR